MTVPMDGAMPSGTRAGTPQVLLGHHLKQLKLPTILREYDKVARECAQGGIDHSGYLLRLVELELIDRERRVVERRIRAARFPAVKSFDTFDFTAIPSLNKMLVLELGRCEFILRQENIIALGNSEANSYCSSGYLTVAARRSEAGRQTAVVVDVEHRQLIAHGGLRRPPHGSPRALPCIAEPAAVRAVLLFSKERGDDDVSCGGLGTCGPDGVRHGRIGQDIRLLRRGLARELHPGSAWAASVFSPIRRRTVASLTWSMAAASSKVSSPRSVRSPSR